MPINSAYIKTIKAGLPYYRITARSFLTKDKRNHKKVVNGDGTKFNKLGSRYNFPAAVCVYLTEVIETCLAEKMFYVHRDVLRSLDSLHYGVPVPAFTQDFVLWEVVFKQDVDDVCDLSIPLSSAFFQVFPTLMRNPSQDYEHLKQRRADIQADGYQGIVAPSSRCTKNGNMVVLFGDQSQMVQTINPFIVTFRLNTITTQPFVNHAVDMLDFSSGEVQIKGSPSGVTTYSNFSVVKFNH